MEKKIDNDTVISLRMPTLLRDAVDSYAYEHDLSMSAAIRIILLEYLTKYYVKE